jgi:Tol biopolymer transport system component
VDPTGFEEGTSHAFDAGTPDGKKIAFTSNGLFDGSDAILPPGDSFQENLWIADFETSALTPLTHFTTRYAEATQPSWSPDGKEIAYRSSGAFEGSNATNVGHTTNVWIISTDGSNARPLTSLAYICRWRRSRREK